MPAIRKILYLLAVVIAILALAETLARLREREFPFVPPDAQSRLGFQIVTTENPLVETATEHGSVYRVRSVDRTYQKVPVKKDPGEIRIVLLGGSAAAGVGVAPPAGFGSVMERILNEAAGGRRVLVINLSSTGHASAQLAYYLEKTVAQLQPDLVLTVMGNNEYLDLRAINSCDEKETARLAVARRMERTFGLARFLRPKPEVIDLSVPSPRDVRMTPGGEVSRFADDRLRWSLVKMKQAADSVGAGLTICSVAVNHRFASEREWFFAGGGTDMPEDFIRARWAMRYEAYEKAAALMKKRIEADAKDYAARLILGLAQLKSGEDAGRKTLIDLDRDLSATSPIGDPFSHRAIRAAAVNAVEGQAACAKLAGPWIEELKARGDDKQALWRLGTLLSLSGRAEEADAAFRRILNTECFVADESINATLAKTAKEIGAHFFDLESEVIARSPQRIPGWETFLDYCHYNVRGNILVAHLLAGDIAALLKLPGKIPDAETALSMERNLRRARTEDLPDLRYWAGADFDPTILVDEKTWNTRDFFAEIETYMEKNGKSAAGLTFLGNWAIYYQHPKYTRERVRALYLEALSLDPGFEAAKNNLEFLDRWNP